MRRILSWGPEPKKIDHAPHWRDVPPEVLEEQEGLVAIAAPPKLMTGEAFDYFVWLRREHRLRVLEIGGGTSRPHINGRWAVICERME